MHLHRQRKQTTGLSLLFMTPSSTVVALRLYFKSQNCCTKVLLAPWSNKQRTAAVLGTGKQVTHISCDLTSQCKWIKTKVTLKKYSQCTFWRWKIHTHNMREFFNTTKGRWIMTFNAFESFKGENMWVFSHYRTRVEKNHSKNIIEQ